MKTPTNNLFQLVQSMTAAEKRYFKIHFSSNKSLVTKLFDFINTMSEYDEEIVKENFKDSKLSKNLKVYKIMLIDLLLKSLSSFRYKKNLNSNIKQSIDEVEILIGKKLYFQAYKRLMRTKEVCKKFEELNYLLTVLELEFHLIGFYGIDFPSNSEDVLEESNLVAQKIKDIKYLHQLNFKLSSIANQLITKKPDLDTLKEFEVILLEKEATLKRTPSSSFKENYYLYSALSHLYHCSGEQQKEYDFKTQMLTLFHDNPIFTENNPKQYWAAYYNLINCCSRTGKEKEMLSRIKELKEFTESIPMLQRKMILIYLVEIIHSSRKNDFQHIEESLEPLALEHIKKLNNEHGRSVVHTHLALALTYLSQGNQTKVQFYLRRLFQSGKSMDDAFGYFFEVINFISHYEAKDFDILRNLLISKKRKIKRDDSFGTPFFKDTIKLFSDLIEKDADKSKLVKSFKKQIPTYGKDNLFILMKHYIFDNWIDALDDNTSFAEKAQQPITL